MPLTMKLTAWVSGGPTHHVFKLAGDATRSGFSPVLSFHALPHLYFVFSALKSSITRTTHTMSHSTKSSLLASKYPKPAASVAVKASSSSTTASTTVAISKFCTACRATVPQDSPYKWCIRCRSKDKEKRKRKASRRTSVLPTPGTIPMDTVRIGNVTVNTLYMTLDDVAGFSNDFEPLPPKKKLKKEAPSHKGKLPLGHGPDVPIKDKIRAYVKARRAQEGSDSTLGERQVRQMNSVSMDVWTPAECLEFQTSTALYGALAAEVKRYYKNHTTTSSRITFRGCYSIVMDPNMPHSRRIDGEATLVRKISKLPHGYVSL